MNSFEKHLDLTQLVWHWFGMRSQILVVGRPCQWATRLNDESHLLFLSQVKSDPFKKEPSKKEAEEKNGSSKSSSDKRSAAGTKTTSKWVKNKYFFILLYSSVQLLCDRLNLLFVCLLMLELSHLAKKRRRSRISHQTKTAKIPPRNRSPKVSSLSRWRPARVKTPRKMRRNTAVGLLSPSGPDFWVWCGVQDLIPPFVDRYQEPC